MRCGPSAGRTASALAVRRLIAVLAVACPGVLWIPHFWIPHFSVMAAAIVLVAAVPVTAVVRDPLRSRCRPMVVAVLSDIGTVRSRLRRAAGPWGGPLAFAWRGVQRRAATTCTPRAEPAGGRRDTPVADENVFGRSVRRGSVRRGLVDQQLFGRPAPVWPSRCPVNGSWLRSSPPGAPPGPRVRRRPVAAVGSRRGVRRSPRGAGRGAGASHRA
ncbi:MULTISPECIES: hypothetical protein [unclassified Streptomyces]|uniref:hypothetical protein n=1 Tax=unclassified Streptomyces TaxID=2593676 RepID=UPI001CD68B54|nr:MULTISPECIES: hypothetical protein [unclassified Streptomyces]